MYTREELKTMYNSLANVQGLVGVKLLYARQKNLSILKEIVSDFEDDKIIPKSKKFEEFEEKEKEINIKFATKDGVVQTKTITVQGVPTEIFDLDYKDPEYVSEIVKIREEYKDEILHRTEQVLKYSQFLLEKHDEKIEFYKVKLEDVIDDLPKDQERFDSIAFFLA